MFGSGHGTAYQSSGLPGPILIPTRFVWPYGGRRVFLSGSFTRWLEHIPMSPMEGCPTAFQVVWNLTPGYHQYKFLVDGEWRHNEQLPFVTGNCGIVNTVFLTGEPDTVPTSFSPETSGRSNMDVDNEVFTRMEVAPRISAAELEVSRQRISVFLSTHTAYELLPESGKVIALDVNLPVKEAFHILHEQGVPVAPLWDFEKGQFVGVLSALDFILILRELGNHGPNLTGEELETHTIAAWKEGKLNLNRQLDGNGRCYPPHLISAGPYDSLKEVAVRILQNKVATVPILHTSSEDGSFPQLLHLASLSGILKCICRHFRHSSTSLPILQHPISEFRIGTWVPNIGESNGRLLAMLRPNSSLADALSLLVQAEVSSIPIVDDNDSLLDVYSRSDITALARDKAYAQIRLDQLTIHQTLQLGQNANSPYGFFSGQRCQMCLRSDPLHKVMERLANPGVRRLVIVEAGSKRVEGIISLSDVFRFLLGLA
ncbi:putative CBS domain, immunoglobulin E-set [Rosa chinensis]|uniref:Putative CBS domain, immunoglobulin E-set n=1 Tax=Rosa chinensis TaxID=74649 RepID=A0A2P6R6Z8_ROSCH|nr:sucrose nonfermenting 4-like protein [Rosa chinensis]PRQ42214.1 putative CBS domain, immunoglobulin E-set [Rosa chinensis]